ncbi:imm11 family protein [Endozoicomonas arenosclerae]|uniref:imm11 family protein n=1 Tax=Endozoicomonas arenosclerae TaxID=1633495 RepID=UPI0012947897|nr:DUF1629 domain-containing protein [Endozoicomonas arenosclerae]
MAMDEGEQLSEYWVKCEGVLEDDLAPGDICRLQVNELMLSEKAYSVLKPILTEVGEVLPVTYQGADWYFLNVLKAIDADESNSHQNEFSQVDKIAFKSCDIEGQTVWTSPFGHYSYLYCSERFVELVQVAELTGIAFEQIDTV